MTSFNFNYPFKGPIPKHSHILRYRGKELQLMDIGGGETIGPQYSYCLKPQPIRGRVWPKLQQTRCDLSAFPKPSFRFSPNPCHLSSPCAQFLSHTVSLEVMACSSYRAKFRENTSLPIWELSNFIWFKKKRQYFRYFLESAYWSSLPSLPCY